MAPEISSALESWCARPGFYHRRDSWARRSSWPAIIKQGCDLVCADEFDGFAQATVKQGQIAHQTMILSMCRVSHCSMKKNEGQGMQRYGGPTTEAMMLGREPSHQRG